MMCSADPLWVFHEKCYCYGINQEYISSYKIFLMLEWDESFSNLALSQNFTYNINEQINVL